MFSFLQNRLIYSFAQKPVNLSSFRNEAETAKVLGEKVEKALNGLSRRQRPFREPFHSNDKRPFAKTIATHEHKTETNLK